MEGVGLASAHHLARLLPGSAREMCLIKTQVIDEPRHSYGSGMIMNCVGEKNRKNEKVGGAKAWPSFPQVRRSRLGCTDLTEHHLPCLRDGPSAGVLGLCSR